MMSFEDSEVYIGEDGMRTERYPANSKDPEEALQKALALDKDLNPLIFIRLGNPNIRKLIWVRAMLKECIEMVEDVLKKEFVLKQTSTIEGFMQLLVTPTETDLYYINDESGAEVDLKNLIEFLLNKEDNDEGYKGTD